MKSLLTAALVLSLAWGVFATLGWWTESQRHEADRREWATIKLNLATHGITLDPHRPDHAANKGTSRADGPAR